MKKLIPFILLIAAVSITPSCNKNDAPLTPDTIDSVKIFGVDSTQLLKSITTKGIDKGGNYLDDSSTIYVYYDTLNKRAIFSFIYTGTADNPNYFFQQTYNDAGKVIRQKINPAVADDPSEAGVLYLSYDDKGVVSDETFNYDNGTVENDHLQKTDLPGGAYSLSTVYVESELDSSLDVEVFDQSGNELSNSSYSLPSLGILFKDSVLYDASGNVTKVLETSNFGPDNQSQQTTYSLFEFTRDTKGSQFSDFNNTLFSGISKFSDFEDNTITFNGFHNFYYYQFTRFPSVSTKAYEPATLTYVTFNPDPQYDNLGRLVKYKMYNGDDPYYYEEFDLAYYK